MNSRKIMKGKIAVTKIMKKSKMERRKIMSKGGWEIEEKNKQNDGMKDMRETKK